MASSASSLKRRNLPVVVSVLAADALLLFLALNDFHPPSPDARLLWSRAMASLLAPLVALLLADLLPATAKDVLVFWRWPHPLPGHRSFTEQFLGDPRVDREKLARNLTVSFPSDAIEQNRLWYRLFKKVEADVAVDHCNRSFLLYREIAAVSMLITVASVIWWAAMPNFRFEAAIVASVFAAQFLATAISSANQGRRLVATVLAAHGVKRRA